MPLEQLIKIFLIALCVLAALFLIVVITEFITVGRRRKKQKELEDTNADSAATDDVSTATVSETSTVATSVSSVEVVQNTYIHDVVIDEKVTSFDEARKLLYTAVETVNQILAEHEQNGAKVEDEAVVQAREELLAVVPNREVVAFAKTERMLIADAYKELPPQQKKYFDELAAYMRDSSGLKYYELKYDYTLKAGNNNVAKLAVRGETLILNCLLTSNEVQQYVKAKKVKNIFNKPLKIKITNDITFDSALFSLSLISNQWGDAAKNKQTSTKE